MTFFTRHIFSACAALLLLAASSAHSGDYIIGEGDKLQISVWGVASLNVEVRVRPDGMITVPGVGDVAASARKPSELQKELTLKLKDLVKNPLVTVTVSEFSNTKVFIFGGGTKPAIFDITRKTTLLQILCGLGDLKVADLKKAYLLRNNVKIKEDFHALFINGDIREDVPIEANDALFVPLLIDKSIYVVGGVNGPKAIEFREGITVMEVILEAGGFNKFASQNDTIIIRTENGTQISIPVKAKKLIKDADLSQNVKLKPGDFVVVEESLF